MVHLLMRIEGDVGSYLDMKDVFSRALQVSGATVLKMVEHRFTPRGLTMIAVLAESHATVHTWPEKGYAMIDYFSCSDDPRCQEFADTWFNAGFAISDCDEIMR